MLAPACITYLYLKVQKQKVRKEVKHLIMDCIDKEDLTYLKFSAQEIESQLNWKHSKEFEFQGQMYDIVYKVEKPDSIIYWCWPDHEESMLNRDLDELVASILGLDPHRHEKNNQLFDFYKKLFKSETDSAIASTQPSIYTSFFYLKNTKDIFSLITDPPPKFV